MQDYSQFTVFEIYNRNEIKLHFLAWVARQNDIKTVNIISELVINSDKYENVCSTFTLFVIFEDHIHEK